MFAMLLAKNGHLPSFSQSAIARSLSMMLVANRPR